MTTFAEHTLAAVRDATRNPTYQELAGARPSVVVSLTVPAEGAGD